MKVRLLTGLTGRGFSYAPQSVINVSDVEAKRLIAAGYAVAIEDPGDEYEAAIIEPRERAVKPKRSRGR